jgi:hypothetical protein
MRIEPIAEGFLVALLAASLSAQEAAPARVATTRQAPNTFGVDAYSVTTVSATAFLPKYSTDEYGTSGSLGSDGALNTLEDFYSSLDLPAGVLVDYIGLNSFTDTDFALGVALYERYADGSIHTVGTFSSTTHGWATDYNASPFGWPHTNGSGRALILNVELAPSPNLEYFGFVEVWWRRMVSPAPGSPTFADVLPSDPGFQYIEALAASGITGGCGGGNYCPNANLTRRQMAIFLAKALGLHWPL